MTARTTTALAWLLVGCPDAGGLATGMSAGTGTTGEAAPGTTTEAPESTTAMPGTTGNPQESDATGPDTSATASDDTSGGSSAQCDGPSVFEAGVHTGVAVTVDGESRAYDLFVPTGYDAQAHAPLVLNFHGLLGTPAQQAGFSQFNGAAEAHGMLVAYPAGIGNSFNAGSCCGDASAQGIDDVAFARAIVQDVGAKMCVDADRVYATGMSNGGHMAHRLGCEAADLFAGVASVAGVLRLAGPCVPARPISVLQFHGTSDLIVPYGGFSPVRPLMEEWAARNGCSAVPHTTFEQGDTVCETWPDCNDAVEVTLCTIDGGGHCWPGNASCSFGDSTTELHASDEIAAAFDP